MQESRFLIITSFLVLLVGAPAIYSVVKEPQVLAERNHSGAENSKNENSRKPASVVAQLISGSDEVVVKTQGITESVTLNLGCDSKDQEVTGTHLRVTGSSCANEDVKELSVVNVSNGFTAAVIFTKGNAFTTDFIDLKDGENNFEILTTDGRGQKSKRSFVVKRLPASL